MLNNGLKDSRSIKNGDGQETIAPNKTIQLEMDQQKHRGKCGETPYNGTRKVEKEEEQACKQIINQKAQIFSVKSFSNFIGTTDPLRKEVSCKGILYAA